MSLRDQVDRLLPGWRQWYPSLFDAAADLGLIRARVCPPGSLLLSRRHADVQRAAKILSEIGPIVDRSMFVSAPQASRPGVYFVRY